MTAGSRSLEAIASMSSAPQSEPGLTEEAVINYLLTDPGFFHRNTHLLPELDLPHETGKAVSLIERQVAILRERNVQMRRRMNDLVQAARANDELFAKIRTLTLSLLNLDDWRGLNELLATYVLTDFDADFVCCHLLALPVQLDHVRSHEVSLPLARFAAGGKPACRTLRAEELALLFPSFVHDNDGSAVLVPLTWADGEGMLAIGSRHTNRFTPDMDTLFVGYIGEVLGRVIQRLTS
jgi:uncharacterized protein YigA (DUF484 family)